MSLEVRLIATHHFDPNGPARLRRALNRFNPNAIANEIEQERALQIDLFARKLRQVDGYFNCVFERYLELDPTLDKRRFRSIMLNQGYEHIVGSRFCQERGIDYVMADPATADTILTTIDSVPDEEENGTGFIERAVLFYAGLSRNGLKKFVRERYAECKEEGGLDLSPDLAPDFEKRDEGIAAKIIEQTGLVVATAGNIHVYGNYNNVYKQLRRLEINVVRMTLPDAEFKNKRKKK